MQLKNLKYPSSKLMPLERQYSKQKKETGAGMPLGLQVFTSPDSNQLDKKWQSSTLEASWHLLNL